MEKNKKIIILLIPALIFLIVFLYFIYSYITAGPAPLPGLEEEVQNREPVKAVTIEDEFNVCISADYDETYKFGENSKDSFYVAAEAMAERNVALCNSIKDEFYNKLCRSDYYTLLTLKDRTGNFLDKIAELGEAKATGEAYVDNNPSLCGKISDEVEKKICLAMATLNPDYCKFTSDEYTTANCLSVTDKQGESNRGCDVSKDESASLCMNSFYAAKAFKDNDSSICQKIDNVTGRFTRLYCTSLLSADPKAEINAFFRENSCYEKYATRLAKEKNDPTICEGIPLKDGHNGIIYGECVGQLK